MMRNNRFSILVLLASLYNVVNAELHGKITISEAYLRQTSGNQPSAFVELFNEGVDTRASNYQLCYGADGECIQLGGGMWSQDTYYVLCSDMSAHAHCRQGLSFVLSGVTSLEIKDIYWNSLDTIEVNGAIPGASYQRNDPSVTVVVASSIQSPGSGYLGGPEAPIATIPEDTEGYGEFFQLFINEYNAEEGWVEIGYMVREGQDIGDYALTVYDPVTGKYKYATRIINADLDVGTTMNGLTFATKFNIPNYGEQYSGVTLSGDGVVWDAISYDQPFVAQNGPGQGAVSQGLQYLHGIRTGEGCNRTALAWDGTNVGSSSIENPGELVTCNGQRTTDSAATPCGLGFGSCAPTTSPSVSDAPSNSPTTDFCAQGVCDTNADCQNFLNDDGYICTCNSGYQGAGTAGACTDIDECVMGTNDCDPDAICTNTIGSFNCTCKAGFWGSGQNCADIPECNRKGKNKVCNRNDSAPGSGVASGNRGRENCVELTVSEGGFRCDCKSGLVRDANNLCVDVDECTNNPCADGTQCVNEFRTYTCLDITGSPTKPPTPGPTVTPSALPSSNAPSLSFVPSNSFIPTLTPEPSVTFRPTQLPSVSPGPSDAPSVSIMPSASPLPSLSLMPTSPTASPVPSDIPSLSQLPSAATP